MNQSSAQYFRALGILHIALCAGVVMFAAVILLLKYVAMAPAPAPELQHILLPAAIVVAITGIAASHLLYKKRLEPIRNMDGLQPKLDAYRGAQILRWALLEGGAMMGLIGALLTMNMLFLAIAAVPLFMMIVSRAGRDGEEIGLSWEEWDEEVKP